MSPPEGRDPWTGPEARRYAKRMLEGSLRGLDESAIAAAIIGDVTLDTLDIQQATEIGAMLLLGKPVLLGVTPGTKVPPGLARAADAIVEVDIDDPVGTLARMQAAIDKLDAIIDEASS